MSALTARITADFAAAAAPADEGRRAALAALAAEGLPLTRDENWKYANLRLLERVRFSPAAAAAAPEARALPATVPGFTRYVFSDGRFRPELSAGTTGVFTRLSAPSPVRPPPRGDARFALLNAVFATDGARVSVPDRTSARLELVFVSCTEAEAGASYPRLEIELGAGATLELIERHESAAQTGGFVDAAVRATLAEGARLRHYRLQELSATSVYFDTLEVSAAARAHYALHAVSTGARAARSTQSVTLAGAEASLSMAAVALGDGQQVQDSYAVVHHEAPQTRTEQLFRGIAAGRARVAFNGKIVVARAAAGTDSQQSLKGLLAGAQAEIDVRPQLEIYTDAVRCAHGATAGKLDDNMLFYLLARGLDPHTAQRLLKWAFLADAFARIEVAPLRHQIEEHLAGVLRDEALKELL